MPERPVVTRARRRTVRRRWAVAALGVVLLGVWGRQPVRSPDAVVPDTVVGLRVGETAVVPGVPGATVRVDAVAPVTRCTGRWWPGAGTLLSGPVTRVEVVVGGVDQGTATRLAADLVALDVLGRPYAGQTACECQGLCEREAQAGDDGWEQPVLLETGLTFAGLRLATPAGALRWDV